MNTLNEPSPNYFGGSWTEEKIEIFLKYCSAYLEIMKKQSFKLIYFDGFAGSGTIENKTGNALESVAIQVLSMDSSISFDRYYLVELDKSKKRSLEDLIKDKFPDKINQISILCEDCNVKLRSLAEFLNKNKYHRALAFLDPFGMSVEFESLKYFKGLGCDMWVLFPSGIGVNRLLKKQEGLIPSTWYAKLEIILGMSEDEIRTFFYKKNPQQSLFSEESSLLKQKNPINRIMELYSARLKEVWKFVSTPHEMKNSTGSTMFHFLLVSQNSTAVKIADNIVKQYNQT